MAHPGRAHPAPQRREGPRRGPCSLPDAVLPARYKLSINFVRRTPDYESYSCLPEWTREMLEEHGFDAREHLYTREQPEGARSWSGPGASRRPTRPRSTSTTSTSSTAGTRTPSQTSSGSSACTIAAVRSGPPSARSGTCPPAAWGARRGPESMSRRSGGGSGEKIGQRAGPAWSDRSGSSGALSSSAA